MVIANGLPLRRKLQRFPESAQVRRALIASAADEFPFAGDEVDCALGLRGADAYLYALTRARRAILQESLPPVHGLLVASSTDLSIATCLTTLDQFDRFGQVMSLGGAPRYLPRHYLLNVFLGMLLAIQVSLLSYALLSPHWLERHLDQEIAALDRGHGELARLQAVSERMVHAQTAAASLAAAPAARLPALLEQTFATVPEGHGISTLEWKDGVLYLRGSGPDPGPWLRATGFSGDEIVIEEKLGGRLNWRAQKKL